MRKHHDVITSLCFSPDGSLLLTNAQDKSTQLWDLASRKTVRPALKPLGFAKDLAFRPGGKSMFGLVAGTVVQWDVPEPVTSTAPRVAAWVTALTGLSL